MLRWKNPKAFDEKEVSKSVNKYIFRIYVVFFVGLTARVLNLNLEKMSAPGIEFSISNKDLVPGLFFTAILFMYIFGFIASLYLSFSLASSSIQIMRTAIYRAAVERTLIYNRLTAEERRTKIAVVKIITIIIIRFHNFCLLSFILIPLLYVLLVEHSAIWATITHLYAASGSPK